MALCTALPAAAQPVRSDQEVLIQLERDWDAALRRNDVKTIERMLAEEFVVTYDDGSRADRTRELEIAATFNQNVESSTLDEFVVKVLGNTAVVWFRLTLVGPMQGKRTELAFRYTDVWVMRDGRWQCVSSQSTRVAEPKK